MTDAQLLAAETAARENAHAKVQNVTPPEKGRIACQRANEWIALMVEIKRRGLSPVREATQ